MNIVYGVELSSGEYSDYRSNIHFVTEDKELAEKYIDKYNKLLVKMTD